MKIKWKETLCLNPKSLHEKDANSDNDDNNDDSDDNNTHNRKFITL